jgi:SAM-dependent methyltransferase
MSEKQHWERVYTTGAPDTLGWYKSHLETPLAWIDELALSVESPVMDAGGGASTLVDDLLKRGYEDITVLDISSTALAIARERLGSGASLVSWVEGDITSVELPRHRFALWHDRAVFHFLTTASQRHKYVQQLRNALWPDGYLILGVFSHEAPPKCSGLPVQRYGPDDLLKVLGSDWIMVRTARELHVTPSGVEQMYLYCQLRHAD